MPTTDVKTTVAQNGIEESDLAEKTALISIVKTSVSENGIEKPGLEEPSNLPDVMELADDIFNEGIDPVEVQRIYALWAKDYEKDLIRINYQGWRNTAVAVADALGERKDARILDMACGTGRVGAELITLGFSNIDGLDPNPVMMRYAKHKAIYKKLIQAYLGPTKVDEIENGTYDAACVNAAFGSGHLNSSCFGEMIRIVRKGGFIVLQLYEKRLTHKEVKDVRDEIERRVKGDVWRIADKSIKFAHEDSEGDRIGEYLTLQVL